MVKELTLELPAPRENPHLFGHEAAEARFLQDVDAGKLHHAYLITGPKGIGKATFAFRMARHILAQGAQVAAEAPAEPEGFSLFGDALPTAPAPQAAATNPHDVDSPLFRRIASGSHTDLLSLSPAYDAKKGAEKASISVDDARKVPQFMNLTPAEGAWRVVVVDAVDQLNNNAANALLKIMEEPPAQALLLLVCHAPGAILPTIKSRCRQFALGVPDRAAFEQVLSTLAPSISVTDYASLYALADGSPGLAMTLVKHHALRQYEDLLRALSPDADAKTKAKFIDMAASIKSPEGWAMLLHGWNMAMHRLSLHPHAAGLGSIFRGEEGLIATIAQQQDMATRQAWMASSRLLLQVNDTYNLDKRTTLRLMLEPTRLVREFPAAA